MALKYMCIPFKSKRIKKQTKTEERREKSSMFNHIFFFVCAYIFITRINILFFTHTFKGFQWMIHIIINFTNNLMFNSYLNQLCICSIVDNRIQKYSCITTLIIITMHVFNYVYFYKTSE